MAAALAPTRPLAKAEIDRLTVLLVEGETVLATTIAAALEGRGAEVWHARSGAEAKALVRQARPRLIVLDLLLPDVDGLLLMGDLTAIEPAAVIILSPNQQRRDVVLGLRLGADDVVSKPVDVDELVARVQAVLRRLEWRAETAEVAAPPARPVEVAAPPLRPETYAAGPDTIVLDRRRGRATVAGSALALTPIEFRLLETLLDHDRSYVPREELIEAAWGHPDGGSSRALDVHVARLRGKLRAAGGPAASIEAVRLPGYRLIVADVDATAGRPSDRRDPGTGRPRRSRRQALSEPRVTAWASGAPDGDTNR
jgi:DNA-binding response OmpR family regulator